LIGICDAIRLAIKNSDVCFMELKGGKDDESPMEDYEVFRKDEASSDRWVLTNDPHELDNVP
jgi:hypothetical protein